MTLPASPGIPCDGVFATAVLSQTRILATFYWARYMHYGKPLVLCDYEVGPLRGDSWRVVVDRLRELRVERRSRLPEPLGVFVETEMLAAQIAGSGVPARAIPSWLTAADSWGQVVQSAAGLLAAAMVGYTRQASARMDQRPFLTESGVVAGPRTDDPIAPAFLFGVVLALDPVAARDPHPRPPKASARK